jgi:2-polyprenyl-3-methyl-5-hydroxy-6-metoxy-1,4-benzoquinol methylase
MEKLTDWTQLWRELAEMQSRRWHKKDDSDKSSDHWRDRARHFDACVKRRWAKPDSSRDFIIAQLEAHPGATVLDIGAGTGAWAVLLAKHARQVTAIEPSSAMLQVMRENLEAEGIDNVEIVQEKWPGVSVEPHDFSICSHAMYGSPDFPDFVGHMVDATKQICFLMLRAPTRDGVMAQAAQRVLGHMYDSPNFQVAYNALLQMGIFPNVLVEDTGLWEPWVNETIEDALEDVKRRLGLAENDEHDQFLKTLLHKSLTRQDGQYVWPRGVRSMLVYWNVND